MLFRLLILAAVIYFALSRIRKLMRQSQSGSRSESMSAGKNKNDRSSAKSHQSSSGDSSDRPQESTPYEILGVSPNSRPEEIDKAYRSKVAQYHPDKLEHLGEEFQILAQQKMKALNRAYDQLRKC